MADETSSQAQAAREQAASRVVYVEELADPDDYWLSITSAARVSRRQDITIRRWVYSGLLPVRGEPRQGDQPGAPHPVGLNKRTRYVRASDLARLTPIIDPSAVLIGEEGRLDLPSIPVEQAAIKAAHQQLLSEVAELRQQAESQALAVQVALAEHAARSQQDLETVRTTLSEQIAGMGRVIEMQHRQYEELAELMNDHQRQLDQVRTDLSEQDAAQQQRLQSLAETLRERDEDITRLYHQLKADVTQQHQEIWITLRKVEQMLAESQQESERALQGLHEQIATGQATFTQQIEGMSSRLEALAQTVNQRLAALGELAETLSHQLTQEAEAREALAKQMETRLADVLRQVRTLEQKVERRLPQRKP